MGQEFRIVPDQGIELLISSKSHLALAEPLVLEVPITGSNGRTQDLFISCRPETSE